MGRYTNYSILFVFFVLLAGCAKFELLIEDLTSVAPPVSFSLTTPTTDQVFFMDHDVVISGVCDPQGGPVLLSGNLFNAPVITPCDTDGEYTYTSTIPPDIVSNRDSFNVVAEQEDFDGNLLDDNADNLRVHCTEIATSELLTCTQGGSGNSVADPYLVADIECLQEMRDGVMCNYALAADIDATVTRMWNGGMGFEPVPPNPTNNIVDKFEGTLEGNGHTITGLVIHQRYNSGTGIFSKLHSSYPATLPAFARNINFVNAELNGHRKMGLIAGELSNAEVENITITDSTVTSLHNGEITYIGGVAGHMENSKAANVTINNLSMEFSASSSHPLHIASYLGGVAGSMGGSIIEDTTVDVTIGQSTAPNSGGLKYHNIGGISGWANGSTINRVNITNAIQLSSEIGPTADPLVPSIANVGGVFGQAFNLYHAHKVCNSTSLSLNSDNGARKIGGFTGELVGGAVDEVHNTGSINVTSPITKTVTDVGGYLGSMEDSNSWNILSDINADFTSGYILNAGGFVGNFISPSGGFTFFSIASLASFSANILEPSATETSQGGLIGRYASNPSNANITMSTTGTAPFDPIGVAPPGGVFPYNAFSTAQLEVRNSNDYGFDFVDRWARNPTPSIPYLQACP